MRAIRKTNREKGLSLVELLIVLVILGLAAYIGTIAVTNLIQKQKLAAATNEVRAILQDVPNQVTRMQAPLFVRYLPAAGTAPARLQVARDAAGTAVLRTYFFPDVIVVETCNWPTTNSGAKALRCDHQNRTTDPSTQMQVIAPQLLQITHARMISGQLKPKRSYEITIAPVWGVSVRRIP